MSIKLGQHPDGPSVEGKRRHFKSYVELANYAEKNLPHGIYFARNSAGKTLNSIRLIQHEEGLFHVEGLGNI